MLYNVPIQRHSRRAEERSEIRRKKLEQTGDFRQIAMIALERKYGINEIPEMLRSGRV